MAKKNTFKLPLAFEGFTLGHNHVYAHGRIRINFLTAEESIFDRPTCVIYVEDSDVPRKKSPVRALVRGKNGQVLDLALMQQLYDRARKKFFKSTASKIDTMKKKIMSMQDDVLALKSTRIGE